jgi:Lar family restriction alleviation protein
MIKAIHCPFCGCTKNSMVSSFRGQALEEMGLGSKVEFLQVKCSDCEARGPAEKTEENAILRWNCVNKDK